MINNEFLDGNSILSCFRRLVNFMGSSAHESEADGSLSRSSSCMVGLQWCPHSLNSFVSQVKASHLLVPLWGGVTLFVFSCFSLLGCEQTWQETKGKTLEWCAGVWGLLLWPNPLFILTFIFSRAFFLMRCDVWYSLKPRKKAEWVSFLHFS